MLHELLLSNDLFSAQENLEGHQLINERQFWRYILGDNNDYLSAQQLEMFLSIKSSQKREIILSLIDNGVFSSLKPMLKLYDFVIDYIVGESEDDKNPLHRRLKARILFNMTIEAQKLQT